MTLVALLGDAVGFSALFITRVKVSLSKNADPNVRQYVCVTVRRRLALYYCALRFGGNTKWSLKVPVLTQTHKGFLNNCVSPDCQ